MAISPIAAVRLEHVLVGVRQPVDACGEHRADGGRNGHGVAAIADQEGPGWPTSLPESAMLRTYSSMNSGLPPLLRCNSSFKGASEASGPSSSSIIRRVAVGGEALERDLEMPAIQEPARTEVLDR